MDYRILGVLEVDDDGRPVPLGGEKQRALLALLLLHHNEVVSTDRLIDELWGESPPPSAAGTLQTYVSRLRKALRANGAAAAGEAGSALGAKGGRLLTQGHRYVLQVAPGELDTERFGALAERGRDALAAGKPQEATTLLTEALGIWRGRPLADFAYEPFAQAEIERLEELRLAAVEDRVEAELALGRARELVGELRHLVAAHPLRERLRGQLMLALYRCGRQAEALEAYQELRHRLSDELGLEPGDGLRQLELAILNRDPTLELQSRNGASGPPVTTEIAPAGAPAPGPRRRARLAVGGVALVAAAVVGGILAVSGGGAATAKHIPGDAVGAVTPSGGVVRGAVALGGSPSAVAAGEGAVWVANENTGTVARIDPSTHAVAQTIEVGSNPSGVAVGADAVWVTNDDNGTVSRIDPKVNRVVQTVPVGSAPSGVAVGDGSVWVANSSDGTLSRIDPTTGAVKATIALGAGATDVAVGQGAVWVSDPAGDRVFRVDPHGDQVTAFINVGSGPTAIAVGYGSVWVTNSLDGTVSRIDPQTNTVSATVPVGDGAGGIAVGAGGVWVASQYAGTVSLIDPATDAVKRTVRIGNHPQDAAVARGLVWVSATPATSSHRGGTLKVLSSFWPDTLDPVLTTAAAALETTNDGLTAYQRVGGSGSLQLVPDLAVSLPSPTDGGTTYTFRLRRGIRYSNGQLVRPEDFRRALERDLILGPNPLYGEPFADVIGGAACAAHPHYCDLSKGVVVDDASNTVTFHLVAPDPEFLARLSLTDAVAVPADTPMHNVGLHPLPTTGPYMWSTLTNKEAVLVRNPYFHEWSHAAQPDGYPNRIVFRPAASPSAEITAIERGRADYTFDEVPPGRVNELQTRFPSQLYVSPIGAFQDELVLNTRVAPFTDVRVRRALNYAIDRAKIARLLGDYSHPSCQALPPYMPGYRPYCPYTLHPTPAGAWHAPNLALAKRLIATSHTRGTPITIWNLGGATGSDTNIEPYLVSLLERLGYPTRIKNVWSDPNAPLRVADSRTRAQAVLTATNPWYPSASQIIQASFACQSFRPHSTGNANISEFCDHRLDAQIAQALTAESNNSPNTAALWARADHTVTEQAPIVALATPSIIDFVSARVGNYQRNFQVGVLPDQLWVR